MSQGKTKSLYLRSSTDRQQKGLDAQERALKNYCKINGINGTKLYKDEGVSGTKSSRPALDLLMKEVRSGKVSTVIVYSFSRFARNVKHFLEALEEFDRLGVRFVSVSESIDTTTPFGKALMVIIAAINVLESDLVSERVKNGLVAARERGQKLGRKRTRPTELILTLRENGKTYQEISELANTSQGTIRNVIKESERSKIPKAA